MAVSPDVPWPVAVGFSAAETVTAGVSSASHAWFRNIDRRIFFSLLLPGVLGGMLGATLLAHVPAHIGGAAGLFVTLL